MEKTVIKSILSEPESDEWSYKRVIGVVGAFALIIDMLLCSFFRWAVAPPEFLADVVKYIVLGCLFGSVGEKVTSILASRGQNTIKTEVTSTTKESSTVNEPSKKEEDI